MKKLLLGVLAIITMFSLVACGEKKVVVDETTVSEPVQTVIEEVTPVIEEPVEEEQVGVGNTDEGMVTLVLEDYIKNSYDEGVVEEVVPTSIKIFSQEEISGDEIFNDYTINEGDIVFSAEYELKIKDGYEDMMQFTAGTGEVDGQWIRNKSNVGIARNGENGYTMDAFGTAF